MSSAKKECEVQEQPTDQTNQETTEQESSSEPVVAIDGLSANELKLTKEVETLIQELAQSKDRYLRVLADMENLRKRLDREKQDLLKFGMEGLIKDMLPVLDSCDKAVTSSEDATSSQNIGNVVEGVKLVIKQLQSVLEKHGLKSVEAMGKPFDPNFHQAIQRMELDDIEVDQVVQEYSKGYTLHDRLIRPAMVVVGIATERNENGQE